MTSTLLVYVACRIPVYVPESAGTLVRTRRNRLFESRIDYTHCNKQVAVLGILIIRGRRTLNMLKLGSCLYLLTAAASGIIGNLTRNLKASSAVANTTVFSELSGYSNLRILKSALEKARLNELLSDRERHFTLFAPTDGAFESVVKRKLLPCVANHYYTSRCSSIDQLLSSTNLKKLLLNHLISGSFELDGSPRESLVHFLGDSIETVVKGEHGTTVGNAAVVVANVQVGNGVLHLIDNVLGSVDPDTGLTSDVSMNADSVQAALKFTEADFFSFSKRQEMVEGARKLNIPGFQMNRNIVGYPNGGLKNHPVLVFDPSMNKGNFSEPDMKFNHPSLETVSRPAKDEDLAFMTILELGALLRRKQVTSVELVKVFTGRLKRYDSALKAVVTFTEELAHEQALAADKLLAEGTYLGPLHGIPYGIKDTMAVPGYKTTWGCRVFKDQVLEGEAGVYRRLKAAGAVLLAKLATGSLAYDDIWFGGRTRNPWNIEEFTTGSSSGPAASTSAGNVPFAIGSETAGSITSPAAKTGVTAFRPTFGMVTRTQVLSCSESLDKIGPFGRTAEDCAIILDFIRGKDPSDLSSKDIKLKDPFAIDVTKLTVGYLPDAEMEVVNVLKEQGVRTVPFNLNYTVNSAKHILTYTMGVDMLSHFDHWQRAGLDDEFESQDQWPVELRRARLISAVDYLQAQRARHQLIAEVLESMKGVDAFVADVMDWERVSVGNLVGMPVIVLPAGFKNITDPPAQGTPRRTTVAAGIYGRPYGDSEVLALGMAFQKATKHHLQRPPIDNLESHDFRLPSCHLYK